MKKSDIKNSIPKVPLITDVEYPPDPEIVDYFNLTPDNSVVPNYDNIAKHYKVSDNMRALIGVISEGVNFPKELPMKQLEVKEAASDEDYTKPEGTDISDALGDGKDRFKPYIDNQEVNDNYDLRATHTLLAKALGVMPIRNNGEKDPDNITGHEDFSHTPMPDQQLVKELVGKMYEDLEDSNDSALTKITEGLNRSLNIIYMLKSHKKGALSDSADDILENFVTYLENPGKLRKYLDQYRKSGNTSGVDEDKKPNAKKPDRNNRYIWMGIPFGITNYKGKKDDGFTDSAKNDAQTLMASVDALIAESIKMALSDPSQVKSILVEVLTPALAGGSSPVANTITGVILKVGGKTIHHNTVTGITTKKDTEQELTTKEASAAPSALAETFVGNFNNIVVARSVHVDNLQEMFFQWLSKNLFEYGTVPKGTVSKVTFTEAFKRIFGAGHLKLTETQKNNRNKMVEWYSSGGKISTNQMKHSKDTEGESLAWYFDKSNNSLLNLANKVAYSVYEAARGLAANNTAGLSMFLVDLKRNMNMLLNDLAINGAPKGVMNWVTDITSTRKVKARDVYPLLERAIKSMMNDGSVKNRGTSIWENIMEDFKAEADKRHALLSRFIYSWGNKLSSDNIARADLGAKFIETPEDFAEVLIERIIEPLLHNGASDLEITSHFYNSLKGLTGDVHHALPVIQVGSGKKVTKTFATVDKNQPYLNVVYLSGDKVKSNNYVKPMTLHLGNAYELVWGPESTMDNANLVIEGEGKADDGGLTNEEIVKNETRKRDMKFKGYIFQVVDGRASITLDQSRLGTNEIPKFIEFATNRYITEALSNNEISESNMSTGGDQAQNAKTLTSYLEGLDGALHAQEMGAGYDDIWEEQIAKLLRGKNIKEIQSLLKMIDDHKEGHLMKAMYKIFGGKIDVGLDGKITREDTAPQKILKEHKNSETKDHTDEMVNNVIEGLTGHLETLKDKKAFRELSNSTEDKDQQLENIIESKEFQEAFYKRCLNTDVSLPSSSDGKSNPIHSLVMASNFDAALFDTLDKYGYHELLSYLGKGKLSTYRADPQVKTINGMLKPFSKSRNEAASKKIWEDARASDTEGFDSVFKDRMSPTVRSNLNTSQINELIELLANSDDLPKDVKNSTLLDSIVVLWSGGDSYRYKVRKNVLGHPDRELTDPARLKKLQKLIATYPSEIRDFLTEKGVVNKYLSKGKIEGKDTTGYVLHPKANLSKFLNFLDKHPELKEEIDASGEKLKAIDPGYTKNLTTRSEADSVTKDDKTKTGLTVNKTKLLLNKVLDSSKDYLETDPDAAQLVSGGKSLEKALAGPRMLGKELNNLKDLTGALTDVLKSVDSKLESKARFQEENTEGSSNVVDYKDVEVRAKAKSQALRKWLLGRESTMGMKNQENVLELLKKFLTAAKNNLRGVNSYLLHEDNLNAVKILVKETPKRG